MNEPFFNIRATKAYVATRLRRIFFGIVSILLYIVLIGYSAYVGFSSGRYELPIIVFVLIGFPLFVVHYFSKAKLENDDAKPFFESNLASELSYEVMRSLIKKKNSLGMHLLLLLEDLTTPMLMWEYYLQ